MIAAIIQEHARSKPLSTPACLYCGCVDLDAHFHGIIDGLGYVPGERTFARCRQCQSIVLSPLPRVEELASFYPPVFGFSHELGRTSAIRRALRWLEYNWYFRPQYQAQVRGVLRACGVRRRDGRRLLDVGCGHGLRLVEFRQLGFEVHGVDLQGDAIRYLQEELGIPAQCAEVSDLSKLYSPQSFDIITTFHMIEHVLDVRDALSAMFSLLKPGGWLAVAVPLVDGIQARALGREWVAVTEAPRHVSLPTQAGVRAALQLVGSEPAIIIPDSTLNCAGIIGCSLVPGSRTTNVYGNGRITSLLARALGTAVTLAAIPFCIVENHVLRRPSSGIIMARKPMA